MSQNVWTKVGDLDDDLLERTVTQSEGPNYVKVSITWRMRTDLIVDGKLVATAGEVMREDHAPSILSGPSSAASQGVMG